jgi:hypothetical protein
MIISFELIIDRGLPRLLFKEEEFFIVYGSFLTFFFESSSMDGIFLFDLLKSIVLYDSATVMYLTGE